jgi:hypothetical protein
MLYVILGECSMSFLAKALRASAAKALLPSVHPPCNNSFLSARQEISLNKKIALFATIFVANYLINTPAVAVNLGFSSTWTNAATPQLQAAKKKNKEGKGAGKIKFDKGSGETTKERDRRLTRECKGRPNAGACLGYAN